MLFKTAALLFQHLPKRRQDAQTARQIADHLNSRFPDGAFNLRSVQRHLSDLSTEVMGPFVEVIEDQGPKRYYLQLSKVANWMMTEENALNLMLASDLLSGYFGEVEQVRQPVLQQVAAGVMERSSGSVLRNIQACVRMVSDGIGRQNAAIDREILQQVFRALGNKEVVKLHYVSSGGEESLRELNPLGLVAKDGTLYLLATHGFETRPKHYPLHRARGAEHIPRPRTVPNGFNLDRYIETSHKLSHVLYGRKDDIELELRVAPESLYHFRERPLSTRQRIDEHDRDERGWYRVTNTLPETVQLVPFLLSHGGWLEVVGPDSVREEMKRRLSAAVAHYQDQAGQ